MTRYLLAGVLMFASVLPAHATPFVISTNGIASGITGLVVNGLPYDIGFVRGIVTDAYPPLLPDLGAHDAMMQINALFHDQQISGVTDGTFASGSYLMAMTLGNIGTGMLLQGCPIEVNFLLFPSSYTWANDHETGTATQISMWATIRPEVNTIPDTGATWLMFGAAFVGLVVCGRILEAEGRS